MEVLEGSISAANAPVQVKPKAKAKSGARKLQAEELAGLLNEATESMAAHKQSVASLKQERSAKVAEKRALTKKIRKERRAQVRKDKVIARRSTWTLVAELERRMAMQTGPGEGAASES